ncbi:hypothetical protein [Roseovarius atlanticus]|uniref:hypothetical protein n=1 Tax=Roseovarius atlanticus TaxID=1641875 RepID=UPI001C9857DF|nr:hypothetical protein [Roseovarius atlanticus]MBY5988205.1 hypothetical protein [Roseovarius atlanticus]MBY6123596.1 hypothetical protein [Roseovarius atlanticus]MBY6148091.1 hypothetical protein [Roseovarius atlanticus]
MAKTTTKKTAAKKPAAKALNPEKLHTLAVHISSFPHGVPDHVIADLEQHEKLKLTQKSGQFRAAMHGLTTKPAPTRRDALTLWANKARREAAKAPV